MRKVSYFPFVLLIFLLFSILSFSPQRSLKLREATVGAMVPLRPVLGKLFSKRAKKEELKSEVRTDLEMKNSLLTDQIESVYKWLTFDQRINEQVEVLKDLKNKDIDDLYWQEFFRRRAEELRQVLEVELQALPANIVFRDPSSWSSSVWINLGEEDNELLGRLIIGKDSPVIVEDSLVGIVEYVGKKQSRVRLITDSGLVPSVRAVRGKSQARELLRVLVDLSDRLRAEDDLFEDSAEKEIFSHYVSKLVNKLKEKKVDYYLAKGELHGSSYPLWRLSGQKLKGIGFNYEYADKEGPSRDLKTGNVSDAKFDFLSGAILREGDLLVTTGMDGVFPAGLKVGRVSKVNELKESDFYYEIEAEPLVSSLSELRMVFVMPPLKIEKD